jgi:hypothetical protein
MSIIHKESEHRKRLLKIETFTIIYRYQKSAWFLSNVESFSPFIPLAGVMLCALLYKIYL